jgi:replicative DNA helicase
MDWERLLISKVAQHGGVSDMVSLGVDDRHFNDDDCRTIWAGMVEHTQRFKKPPSFAAVREMIAVLEKAEKIKSGFRFEMPSDAIEYLAEKFFWQAKRRAAIDSLRNLAGLIDDDEQIGSIDEHFLTAGRDLAAIVPTHRVARFSDMAARIDAYNARAESGVESGVPYGIPDIDRVTNGMQPHEYITVSGWSGRGKSTLTLFFLFNAYLAGKTAMLFSLEMEAEALMRKFDTLATHFQSSALKAMSLGQGDMRKWEAYAERAATAKNDIIVIDDVGRCTVERVYAEMTRYRPDICAVDYVTLMEPSRKYNAHWEGVTYITRDLKATARDLKIPVIGVAQTNASDSGDKAGSNIAYSKSIVRDSDIMFELHCDEDMQAKNQMEVRLVKNRDGRALTAPMLWQVDTMEFKPWQLLNEFQKLD